MTVQFELPPRWDVGEQSAGGYYWIRDNGMQTGIRCRDAKQAQWVADALNIVDPNLWRIRALEEDDQ